MSQSPSFEFSARPMTNSNLLLKWCVTRRLACVAILLAQLPQAVVLSSPQAPPQALELGRRHLPAGRDPSTDRFDGLRLVTLMPSRVALKSKYLEPLPIEDALHRCRQIVSTRATQYTHVFSWDDTGRAMLSIQAHLAATTGVAAVGHGRLSDSEAVLATKVFAWSPIDRLFHYEALSKELNRRVEQCELLGIVPSSPLVVGQAWSAEAERMRHVLLAGTGESCIPNCASIQLDSMATDGSRLDVSRYYELLCNAVLDGLAIEGDLEGSMIGSLSRVESFRSRETAVLSWSTELTANGVDEKFAATVGVVSMTVDGLSCFSVVPQTARLSWAAKGEIRVATEDGSVPTVCVSGPVSLAIVGVAEFDMMGSKLPLMLECGFEGVMTVAMTLR